jgi:O-antigen/teichoic acid export membrane protein
MLKRIAAGMGVNILDKLVIALTQLLMVPLLANAWGIKLYGLWVMLSTIPSFLAMGDLGFATAAGTRMTIAEARGERASVVAIYQSAWGAILLSSVVFGAGALVAAWCLPTAWFGDNLGMPGPQVRLALLLLLLYGLVAVQGSILFAAFRCSGLFALGTFSHTIIILLETGGLVVVVAGFHGQPAVAACALLAGRSLGMVGQAVLLRRYARWLPLGLAHASRAEMGKLVAPAGAVMLLPISQACMLQGTALALGAASGQAAVPVFTAARTLSRVGLQMCWTLNAALTPEVSSAVGRRDHKAIAMMVLSTLVVSLVLLLPFAVGFGAFGQPIIALWSRGTIHAPALMVWVMAMGIVAGGFWNPLSNLVLAVDKQQTYSVPLVVLSVAAVALTYGLAPAWGPTAPAMAMALTDCAMLGLVLVLIDRHVAPLRKVLAAGPQALAHVRVLAGRLRGRR